MPMVVIPHYDRGVRLRLGKPRGVLEPGLHYKIPFADTILTHMVKATTLNLSEQTITTRDGQSIVIRSVIKYEVSDVETLLLEVSNAVDALSDIVQGIIRDKIIEKDWSELNTSALTGEISRASKAEARKWGITILQITITDLALMRSIRLLNK
jgi:membrane protease subunit HflC